ncbi:hypothetical protein Glove_587g5 [Diversispora epigaea]|uniref:Uncharacterized protein n=1 Tax=Diversispora epigaea TaxID=1348612 RepID=A0A397GAT3_9GLOM|nr:hypothetical protein Glove_587g5 [Diversispora epigaea]
MEIKASEIGDRKNDVGKCLNSRLNPVGERYIHNGSDDDSDDADDTDDVEDVEDVEDAEWWMNAEKRTIKE